MASIRLVLPAPLAPVSTTGPARSKRNLRGVIAAEVGQRQTSNKGGGHRYSSCRPVPGISHRSMRNIKDADGRDKPGHRNTIRA